MLFFKASSADEHLLALSGGGCGHCLGGIAWRKEADQGFQRVPCCLEAFKFLRASKKHSFVTPGKAVLFLVLVGWKRLHKVSHSFLFTAT